MTAAAVPSAAPAERLDLLRIYRDDGPPARALARLGAVLPVRPVVLVAAAALVLLGAIVATGGEASPGVAVGVVAAALVLAGASAGRPHTDPLRWAVPPGLRLLEYAGVVWLGAREDALPAAFALLAAVAFRHYDLVYRLRHRGVTPPRWVNVVSGGWDGRLAVACALSAAGAAPEGFFVLAAILATVFVGDSVHGWMSAGRAQRVAYDDEEEDDAQ